MSLMNDYTYLTLNDQRERELADRATQRAGSVGAERSRQLVAQSIVPPRTTTHRHRKAPASGRALSAARRLSQAGGTIVLMVKAARSATFRGRSTSSAELNSVLNLARLRRGDRRR